MSQSSPPRSTLKLVLIGLVAAVALVDLALLAVPTTTSQAELLRLLLAAGAFGAVFIALLVGIVDEARYAVGAVISVPFVALYAYTGLLLPWTQLSFTLGQVGIEGALSVPGVGDSLAAVLFGGTTLTQATLRISFRYHYAFVALSLVGVAAAVGRAGWYRLTAADPGDAPRD
ncbi:cytochrome b N-terminal domain-containing protein [Halobellus rufus]|uniref:cytochrome b N-terminal domain-containing protein n=1 Tax=Halobellus rufus TaxID=1448860 RepID=UPI0006792972|nr:cytochrome b N-terminal domain-containing protein [Halobellus rufus]